MVNLRGMRFLVLVISCAVVGNCREAYSAAVERSSHSHQSGIRAAYWPSFGSFPASSINTSFFTHLIYAFVEMNPETYQLNVTASVETKMSGFVTALRKKKPAVKTLFSIGGGDSNSTAFAEMASTSKTRAVFIASTIAVARRLGFDGVDLDWEFPKNTQEMTYLGLLFQQWRAAINAEARTARKAPLLLTSAVYYSSSFQVYGERRSYPAGAIDRYLDWASPMCFDYHGSWENFTGIHTALYDSTSNISTNYGINSWIRAGVRPKKLVMGLAQYGRTWTLSDPKVHGIGANATGVGPGDGTLVYRKILEFNQENLATVVFDSQMVGYYSYAGTSWIGYDDAFSIALKVDFARSMRLGGYFFWALGMDDTHSTISKQASDSWQQYS